MDPATPSTQPLASNASSSKQAVLNNLNFLIASYVATRDVKFLHKAKEILDPFKAAAPHQPSFPLLEKFLHSSGGNSNEAFTYDEAQILSYEIIQKWPNLHRISPDVLMLLRAGIEACHFDIALHHAFCFLAIGGPAVSACAADDDVKQTVARVFKKVEVIHGTPSPYHRPSVVSDLPHPPPQKMSALLIAIIDRIKSTRDKISEDVNTITNYCGDTTCVPMKPAEELYEELATIVDQDEIHALVDQVATSKVWQIGQNNRACVQALDLLVADLQEVAAALGSED